MSSGGSSKVSADEDCTFSTIQRFYSGASVFVTGATGFMGKVLIEKLLRSCPEIEKVYILVREKKGRKLEERIDDLIKSPCFDRIKQEYPDFRRKIAAVLGDVSVEGLGIKQEDRLLLQQQVDVVFHVAATVRFDEHLKLAILMNVRGTREVLNLCRTFERLKSVVHVSTAYSNCPTQHIGECIYPSPLDSDHAIRLAETHDVTTLDRLSHKLLGDWPNTYSFTKAMSEDVVRIYGQGLPVSIVRPSIVVCTRSEPVPAWIDNMYGPNGIKVAVAAGLLRTMQADNEKEANVVPCDMAVNAMLVTAWDAVENREPCEVSVYNYACPRYNPLTWGNYVGLFVHYGMDYVPIRVIWYPLLMLVSNRLLYCIVRFFVHFLPASIMDVGLLVTARKPQMLKIYNKIHRLTDVISYFSTHQWDFDIGHVEGMWERVKGRDRELFPFNMGDLDWESYIRDVCPGMRIHLYGDSPDTLQETRKRIRRLYILHCAVKGVVGLCMLWILQPIFTAGLQLLKEIPSMLVDRLL